MVEKNTSFVISTTHVAVRANLVLSHQKKAIKTKTLQNPIINLFKYNLTTSYD